jgi:small subunit ribosomal protein S21
MLCVGSHITIPAVQKSECNTLVFVGGASFKWSCLEQPLKRFKRKFEKTGVVKELRRRQAFEKPSITKRQQKLHAIYVQCLQSQQENN